MKTLFVIEERVSGLWVPAIGGGSSTKPRIRAFETLKEAEHAMRGLKLLRGSCQLPKDTRRRITEYHSSH